MYRAPFQALVLPYRRVADGSYEFALFCRADDGYWQGIAGGGEGEETPLEAARREAKEEAGISEEARYVQLDTTTSISVTCFADSPLWGESVYVIPEYAFGVEITGRELVRSAEHKEIRWVPFAEAVEMVRYDSNRIALWELHQRIRGLGPRDVVLE